MTRKLLRRIAINAEQEPDDDDRDILLESLNAILSDPEFFDANYFRDLKLDKRLRARLTEWSKNQKLWTVAEARRINRMLLDAAFPAQIIPRSKQPLSVENRRKAVEAARKELAELR